MSIDENVQKNECSCNTENGKKMMEMLETERKRIVSELHDTSLQNIAHLVHMIELASLYIDKDPARAKMELNSVSKGLQKHSQATRVLFHCKKTEQKYEILIQDNGKGFTMEEAEDKANSHFGLALIHEGVNLLNGTIHVSSAIGRGTTIDIKIPLDLHSAVKKNS